MVKDKEGTGVGIYHAITVMARRSVLSMTVVAFLVVVRKKYPKEKT